jgi:hypothetical protein
VSYQSSVEKIDDRLDLAIIATNSDVRRVVIERLLAQTQVKSLLLEKVVFQSVKDFEAMIPRLEESNVKAWVNFPRRLVPLFKDLRDQARNTGPINIELRGRDWGLGSNTIHILDLLVFLSGQEGLTVDVEQLEPKIYEAKRNGFIELAGIVRATTSRGDKVKLIDNRLCSEDLKLIIEFGKQKITINPFSKSMTIYSDEPAEVTDKPFSLPFQSEVTAPLVDQILTCGSCGLTTLRDSLLTHRPMLEGFTRHLNKVLDKPVERVPIT